MTRYLGAIALVLLASACGGGGGGGGNADVVMTLPSSPWTLAYVQGSPMSPFTLPGHLATGDGNAVAGGQYFSVSSTGVAFVPGHSTAAKDSLMTLAVSLLPDCTLAPGTYTGTVTVRLFSDPGLQHEVPTSGNTVDYSLDMSPGLLVGVKVDGVEQPGWVDCNARMLDVNVKLGQTLEFTSSQSVNWVQSVAVGSGLPCVGVDQQTDTSWSGWVGVQDQVTTDSSSALEFTAYGSDSTQGSRAFRLNVSGMAGASSPPTCTPGATIYASSARVPLTAVAGQQAFAAADVSLTGGSAGLTYSTSVTYGAGPQGWLTVPATGTVPGTLTLAPNTAALAPGQYQATVWITPADGTTPISVTVTYTVASSPLTLTPGALNWAITPTTTVSNLTQGLALGTTGAALAWSATADVPWLSVSPSSGNSGTVVSVTVDPSAFENAANSSYQGTVLLSYSGPGFSLATATVPVTLTLDLPFVTHVGPYVAYVGAPQEVIVRGHGMSMVPNPAATFGGNAGTDVVLVNDTELRVTPPAGLTPGSYAVEIANGNLLGLHCSSAALVVVNGRNHTPELIPSPGPRNRLVYDPERGCLYGAHYSTNAVERFCDDGTTWVATSVAVPQVWDLALSADGKTLVAIAGTALVFIDTATLTVTSTAEAAALGISTPLLAIATTNDGHALVAAGSVGGLYRYDLDHGDAATLLTQWISYPDVGPAMIASLNGDLVYAGEIPGVPRSFAVYQAKDGTVAITTEPIPNERILGINPAADRSGHRFGAYGNVYDETLLPLGYVGGNMAIAANGTRAYAYSAQPPSVNTYDISGSTVSQLGTSLPLLSDPEAGNPVNGQLLTSADSQTLFIDGAAGILVLAAP